MEEILIKSLVIFFLILLLTFLQKYHFKMLRYISSKYHNIFRIFILSIIRFWVIIHELSHLFFWIISWAKIHKVELFRKDWWRVTFWTKNYIWHLWQYWWNPWYLTKLFLNQIWIFLTSIWPLIIWMLITFLLFYYLKLPFEFNLLKDFLYTSNIYIITSILLYIILIPSFILSYQDIKNFIISKQDNLWATIIWSIINTIIFILFLFFLSLFYNYFIIFSIIYILLFTVLFVFWVVNYIFFKFIYI